jgi:hypothetical protein
VVETFPDKAGIFFSCVIGTGTLVGRDVNGNTFNYSVAPGPYIGRDVNG